MRPKVPKPQHGRSVGSILLLAVTALATPWAATAYADQTPARPNVVVILADDLGYGDVRSLNPERGKIATPSLDRLAEQGMAFTDAHTSSSVCTPTRYSLLTGRYHWRTSLQRGVLGGYSPPLISSDRLTIAGFLQDQGYATACVGKWHLGMGMPTVGKRPSKRGQYPEVDWSQPIADGPTARGFDYFDGISASLDMPPFIFIENDRFLGSATAKKMFRRAGPAEPGFEAVDVLPRIGQKTVEFIRRQTPDKPFFVYVPFNSPHTPHVPAPEWRGKSGLGVYGDFVMQTDAVVGQIVAAIDESGFGDNTLVIVTSDNGCSKAAGFPKLHAKGHYPSAHLRGSKADLWEGGHRVPFLVRWPGVVGTGTRCDQLVCQTDIMATVAEAIGVPVPEASGEDSVSFLPALRGEPIESTRAGVVHQSFSGHFAYRRGDWKLLLARGSGGWSQPNEKQAADSEFPGQLYHLASDPGEMTNLYGERPEVVAELLTQLESDVRRGRSTVGPELANDLPLEKIKLWKSKR